MQKFINCAILNILKREGLPANTKNKQLVLEQFDHINLAQLLNRPVNELDQDEYFTYQYVSALDAYYKDRIQAKMERKKKIFETYKQIPNPYMKQEEEEIPPPPPPEEEEIPPPPPEEEEIPLSRQQRPKILPIQPKIRPIPPSIPIKRTQPIHHHGIYDESILPTMTGERGQVLIEHTQDGPIFIKLVIRNRNGVDVPSYDIWKAKKGIRKNFIQGEYLASFSEDGVYKQQTVDFLNEIA